MDNVPASDFNIVLSTQGISPETIQQAKDFIWNHLDEMSRKTLIHIVTTNSLLQNGLTVQEITINRNIIIGVQYKQPPFPCENNQPSIEAKDGVG